MVDQAKSGLGLLVTCFLLALVASDPITIISESNELACCRMMRLLLFISGSLSSDVSVANGDSNESDLA